MNNIFIYDETETVGIPERLVSEDWLVGEIDCAKASAEEGYDRMVKEMLGRWGFIPGDGNQELYLDYQGAALFLRDFGSIRAYSTEQTFNNLVETLFRCNSLSDDEGTNCPYRFDIYVVFDIDKQEKRSEEAWAHVVARETGHGDASPIFL
jgi:hypothetical protein